jgi:hypothetical protein
MSVSLPQGNELHMQIPCLSLEFLLVLHIRELYVSLIQWFSKWSPTNPSALPGSLLEMQIHGPSPRSTESVLLEMGLSNLFQQIGGLDCDIC